MNNEMNSTFCMSADGLNFFMPCCVINKIESFRYGLYEIFTSSENRNGNPLQRACPGNNNKVYNFRGICSTF